MKGIKIPPNRTIGIVLIVFIVGAIISTDWPIEHMYLLIAVTFLLIFALPDFIRFRKTISDASIIQLRSNNWISGWFVIGTVGQI